MTDARPSSFAVLRSALALGSLLLVACAGAGASRSQLPVTASAKEGGRGISGSEAPKGAGTVAAPPVTPPPGSVHTLLGIPRATANDAVTIQDRGEFVLAYDEQIHLARWVAWRVRKADLGKAKRKNQFHADTALPAGLLRIETSDYAHSGYDRGHLCPSADRTATEATNHQTFLMTNMHPQRHALNAGPWEELEAQTRELLKRPDDVVYVVAGPLVAPLPARLGRGVAVPRASYKVLIALKDGTKPEEVGENAVHAAAIMPNDETADGQHWRSFATTIREVEQVSGYDFFSEIPKPVQDAIETRRGE